MLIKPLFLQKLSEKPIEKNPKIYVIRGENKTIENSEILLDCGNATIGLLCYDALTKHLPKEHEVVMDES